MRRSVLPVLCLTVLLSSSAPAHAYIDPAAGSLLLQAVIAGVAGLLLTLKLFWRRLTGWLDSKKPASSELDSTEPEE